MCVGGKVHSLIYVYVKFANHGKHARNLGKLTLKILSFAEVVRTHYLFVSDMSNIPNSLNFANKD